MGIKSLLSRPFARYVVDNQKKQALKPSIFQKRVFENLIVQGRETLFGEDHDLKSVRTIKEFQAKVPIRDYEALKPYVDKVVEGESDVLWKGRPIYFAKTSGTTSGSKFIPITKDSIPNHINSARNALLSYINETKSSQFLDGNLIFLSGSPVLDDINGVFGGRLSGIVNHHVPSYLRSNQKPSYETNCIEDWEHKLDKIIEETGEANMTLISGIPPWMQMYFDKLTDKFQKPIKDIFPNFSLMVHGGVNFRPYSDKLFNSIGKQIDAIETFPASEGFFAFQDHQQDEGLLLQINSGIFYEFVPVSEVGSPKPTRLCINEVEMGVNYAMVFSSNAGLWGYLIGDTVKFVSLYPHKVVVTGRIKHFISAFGEHVIAEEVEMVMQRTMAQFDQAELIEFTVAPFVNQGEGNSYHEWLVSFAKEPHDLKAFQKALDLQLRQLNSYYDDLISGSILSELKLTILKPDAFILYMKDQGKLGGQNKVPRLSNDRNIADSLLRFIKS